MFYRFLSNLLHPFTLLLMVLVIVQLVLWRRRATSRGVLLALAIPTAALYLFCTPMVAYLMLGTLEWPYPPIYERPDEAAAIVVLGSGVAPPDAVRRKAVLDAAGNARCLKAAELYFSGPPCKIVVTGGRVESYKEGPVMAEVMRDLLVQLGVAKEDVIVEAGSTTTHENAVLAAKLLRERGIDSVVVVSDATHLARGVRCFERQGFSAVAAGCQYRATELRLAVFSFLPSLGAAAANEAVFHEYLGLLWYRLHGRI